MRVLVLGARGMLGSEVVRRFKRDFEVIPYDRQEIDITETSLTLKEIKSLSPDVVINTAAYTDVDGCEKNKEHALKVNGFGVRNISEACEEIGAKIIHISTDYIFD